MGLTSHKPKKEEEIPVALALFEPPDPSKKPMYCKHLVYQGVTEFSFEEIRGARYMQRAHAEEVEMKRNEMEDKERKLREEQEAFKIESDKKLLEMHRLNEDLQRQIEALKRQSLTTNKKETE